MNIKMSVTQRGYEILRHIGIDGWHIVTVDDSPELAPTSPACCCYRLKQIILRRSALLSGEYCGKRFTSSDLIEHEVAHILRGGPEHDADFDAALSIVELMSADVTEELRYSPMEVENASEDGGAISDPQQLLREAIGKLEPEHFQSLTHGALRKVIGNMDADQYAAAVWAPKTGLHFRELLNAAGLKDEDCPGGRLTPPRPKVDDDGE
jgi:hypothetical protein